MKRVLCAFSFLAFAAGSAAQLKADTLQLSVAQADSIFLANNVELLAKHMDIDIAQAQIMAARAWDNPVFYSEVDVWNPLSRKAFDVNNGGQLYLQVQQLFRIGGEHHTLVQYNKANKASAEFAFTDLMRNLKFELHDNLFELNALLKTKGVYTAEIERAQLLEKSFTSEYEKNIVPLKDLVRIQSSLFQLQQEMTSLLNQISDMEKEVHQLLEIDNSKFISPVVPEVANSPFNLALDSLYKTALTERPDVKQSESLATAAGWNLKYQRAVAVPDLTVGADYFSNGAASFNNYYGLELSIPLPFWNQNRSGLKTARALITQQSYLLEEVRFKAITEVNAAYEKLQQTYALDISALKTKNENFDKLIQNIVSLYIRHEISLKELADDLDLYKEQQRAFYEYLAKLNEAKEELNYAVGKTILK